jgi:hypothetical protein
MGQKEALLLLLLTLGHMGLGLLVTLFLTSLSGPMAFFVTIGTTVLMAHLRLSSSLRALFHTLAFVATAASSATTLSSDM